MVMNKKQVNCTIVGDGMIGKTCLSKMFVDRCFPDSYVATVFDIFNGQLCYGGDQYKITVMDCAGQLEDEDMREVRYYSTEVFLVCFSVVDIESFESVKTFWLPDIRRMHKSKPIVLVALQTDLRGQSSKYITMGEAKKLAGDMGAVSYVECSALGNLGVKDVFNNIVFAALRHRKRKLNLMKRVLGR